MQAKISIDEIKLLDSHFSIKKVETNDELENDKDTQVNIDIVCSHNLSDDRQRLRVMLQISCDAPTLPFEFNVRYGGAFSFSSVPDDVEMDRFINEICPFHIFPYIREHISELTRKAGFNPIIVQPVNFIALNKQRKAEKEKAESQE